MSTLKGHFAFNNFSSLHILIILLLLMMVAVSAVLAFDPTERKNKIRDQMYLSDAKNVLVAVKTYKEKEGSFPWGTSLNSKDAFGFVSLNSKEVGICGKSCSENEAGVLVSKGYLGEYYLEKEFALKRDNVQDIKIGKANGETSPVFTCYIPLSKFAKEKAAYEANAWILLDNGSKTLGETASGAVCDPSREWSSCYVCTQ